MVKFNEIDTAALEPKKNKTRAHWWIIHADVGNLEFLGKSATIPRYILLAVDLYSSKVYVYPMHLRKQILQKMKQFYDNIKNKRNI